MTHNVAAEQAVIGGLLITPDSFDLISDILSPASFWSDSNRRIFSTISSMLVRGESVDVVTVSETMERSGELDAVGGIAHLAEIQMNTPSAANIRRHAQIVSDLGVERALLDASAKIVSIVEETGTTAEKLDQAQSLISGIAESKEADEPTPMRDALTETITRIQERAGSGNELSGAATGLVDLDKATGGLSDSALVVIAGRPSMGKAQPLDSRVRTSSGWKDMADIAVGDKLASVDGATSIVKGIYPQGILQVYRVTFSDGRSTECCAEHLWRVHYRGWKESRILRTDQIASMLCRTRYKNRLWIDMHNGEFGNNNPLPIDPWLLGALLGDGGLTNNGTVMFSTASDEMLDRVKSSIASMGMESVFNAGYDHRLVRTDRGCVKGFQGKQQSQLRVSLSDLGLSGKASHEKFIPNEYLEANRDARLSVLQGLLDTDGWVERWGSIRFSSSSERLAGDVQTLVRSLGGWCSINAKKTKFTASNGTKKSGKTAYVCNICHPNPRSLLLLSDKVARLPESMIRQKRPTFTSIVESRITECQCIAVDHPDHLYITDQDTVTHNTSLAMQIAEHIGETGTVLVFSLETSVTDLTSRMLASRARIPLDKLLIGSLDDDQWVSLTSATSRLSNNKVMLKDESILTITSMRSQCRRAKRKHGLSLIVVDYLQLMTYSGDNEVKGLTDISRGLKLIGKELGVPVIALSQLNRDCERRPDKRPMLSDLRASGAIEQDADLVIMVYRDEVYNPDSDRKGITELLIRKNRNGGLKDVFTTFIPEFTRFENFAGQVEQQRAYPPKRRSIEDF